jgi:hypothetical protein
VKGGFWRGLRQQAGWCGVLTPLECSGVRWRFCGFVDELDALEEQNLCQNEKTFSYDDFV